MYTKRNLLALVFLLASLQLIDAQNNTNSPYTRFGYGELTEGSSTELRAMGGAAIGNRSNNTINATNPASYSSVDSLTFMFDIGLSALYSHFSTSGNSSNTFNSNLEYLTMRFPLAKWLGFSAGILPYSFSGYNIYQSDSISIPRQSDEDSRTEHYTKLFTGTGGFSQLYGGFSLNLFNHLSLGINSYYLFGQINNSRSLIFTGSNSVNSSINSNSIKISDFRLRYGLQFYNTFAEKHDVTLGLIYENKTKMNGEFLSLLAADTLNYNNGFELPQVFGVGINYTLNNQLTLAVDFKRQNWGDALFFGKTDSLVNQQSIAIGAEYIPNPNGRKYSDRIRYRLGFSTANQYYKVNNESLPNDFNISFGVGFPTRTGRTWLNAALEYGRRGSSSLLREEYLRLSFSASINEYWFFKPKL